MFLGAYFTTGRIIFMIFFITSFIALMVYSYRKDVKNHKRYYKGAVKKVIIYGGLIIAVFIAIRFLWGN
ncbi:MAG: hypothetical protein P8L21_02270 [Polaribacter sp.]|jgi:hypothetical membrane protein|nr:hypothetical protein [Polaribacter sp.]MDG2357090.1 hypothetical protein [Polaribacter sp.]